MFRNFVVAWQSSQLPRQKEGLFILCKAASLFERKVRDNLSHAKFLPSCDAWNFLRIITIFESGLFQSHPLVDYPTRLDLDLGRDNKYKNYLEHLLDPLEHHGLLLGRVVSVGQQQLGQLSL